MINYANFIAEMVISGFVFLVGFDAVFAALDRRSEATFALFVTCPVATKSLVGVERFVASCALKFASLL